ncbi:hypothetical protein CORAM0001_1843 [Corynebacterium amycolatum SK46]|nr:hypothetical protein CORAM0001_1843 [Corynebacterium amycolatum SK46]
MIGIVDTIDAVAGDLTADGGLTTTDYLGDTPVRMPCPQMLGND